jgi:hypothetical protein
MTIWRIARPKVDSQGIGIDENYLQKMTRKSSAWKRKVSPRERLEKFLE